MIAAICATLVFGMATQAGSTAIAVSNAWSRPATGTAVVYATLRNDAALPDRLVGACDQGRVASDHPSQEPDVDG